MKVMSVVPILFIPLQAQFPCALNLYMLTLSANQLAAFHLASRPYFGRMFKIEDDKPIDNKKEEKDPGFVAWFKKAAEAEAERAEPHQERGRGYWEQLKERFGASEKADDEVVFEKITRRTYAKGSNAEPAPTAQPSK